VSKDDLCRTAFIEELLLEARSCYQQVDPVHKISVLVEVMLNGAFTFNKLMAA
jgi:hypothetical protein